MVMMFGGVPTGVPRPPTLAENAISSTRLHCAARLPDRPGQAASTLSPMGIIIAVVATLLIHMLKVAVSTPIVA